LDALRGICAAVQSESLLLGALPAAERSEADTLVQVFLQVLEANIEGIEAAQRAGGLAELSGARQTINIHPRSPAGSQGLAPPRPPAPGNRVVVHFMRHGEVHNPHKVFYGRLPGFHLSATGFAEAAAAGPALAAARAQVAAEHGVAETTALLHSPLLRARETAEVLAAADRAHAGLPLEAEPELLEVHVPLDGTPIADILAGGGFGRLYDHGREAEGFEVFGDVFSRVRRLVGRLLRTPRHAGSQVICVCHGDICLAARLWATKGAAAILAGSFDRESPGFEYPGHCSLTTLLVDGGASAAAGLARPAWLQAPPELRACLS
jgi:broad specificity phosphatase PhoE